MQIDPTDCPACVYDEIYQDLGLAITRLEAWLARTEKGTYNRPEARKLMWALQASQAILAKAFVEP